MPVPGRHLEAGHAGAVQCDILVAASQLQVQPAADHRAVADHDRVGAADAVGAAADVGHVAGLRAGNAETRRRPGGAPLLVWPMKLESMIVSLPLRRADR